MTTIQQLTEERRSSKETAVCTGVFEIGDRTVARVRLASGSEITAYIPRGVKAPEIADTVEIEPYRGTKDHHPARTNLLGADQKPPRVVVAAK